jgi:hypothetical protein
MWAPAAVPESPGGEDDPTRVASSAWPDGHGAKCKDLDSRVNPSGWRLSRGALMRDALARGIRPGDLRPASAPRCEGEFPSNR